MSLDTGAWKRHSTSPPCSFQRDIDRHHDEWLDPLLGRPKADIPPSRVDRCSGAATERDVKRSGRAPKYGTAETTGTPQPKPIDVIVAPFHAGRLRHRVGRGPQNLLDAGLLAALSAAEREVSVVEIGSVEAWEGEIGRSFEVKRRVAIAVAEAVRQGHFPIILAGNCNTSVGVYAGLGDPDLGVVWFDAHADFNTPDEMTSGYFDGMGVATLAGQCWRRLAQSIPGFRPADMSRFVYCGIRDFEPGQREKVEDHGIAAVFGGPDVDFPGELGKHLPAAPDHVMIHVDMDCLDTSIGDANSYSAPGGLSAADLMKCLSGVLDHTVPRALTLASFDPTLRGGDRIAAVGVDAARMIAKAI